MTLKRKLGIAAMVAVFLFILLPALVVSSPVLDYIQRRIDQNPEPPSSRRQQLAIAEISFETFRPERAATGFRLFYERYTTDERRAYALLRYAQSLEAAGRTVDAKEIYRKYMNEYPHLDGKRDAALGINRIQSGTN